ncbi:hypothetical protein GPALN_003621 [Globodera pallida]|nr:hypothetical protein GPALN_003621 [Globodera pallida]
MVRVNLVLSLYVGCIAYLCVTDSTKIHSNVIELSDRFLEVMDQGLWFVVFYAPWCAHCKKLMPAWEHMAHALADKNSAVRVGKLDCTRFSSVSSALHVKGYPTIIFFRNGVQLHYEGERRKEEMVKFVEKCSGPIVDRIDTLTKFAELRKNSKNEPFFVFFDPAQRAEEEKSPENELWRQFEKVSESLFTEVRFFELRDKELLPEKTEFAGNETKVLVFRDLDYLVKFDADKDDLSKWVGRQRWPFLPQITAPNVRTIADSTDKLLVLASVDGMDMHNASTDSGRFLDMVKRTAVEALADVEIEEHFQFGWLDGGQIANGIVMDTLPVPNLVVFNHSSYEYYLSDDQPAQMTAQSLLLFLRNVRQGDVVVQGGRAWITRLRRMVYEITSNVYDMFNHQPILTVCLFGVPLAFFSIITYSICSADFSVERDEIYPDEEEDDVPMEEFDDSGERAKQIGAMDNCGEKNGTRRQKPRSSIRLIGRRCSCVIEMSDERAAETRGGGGGIARGWEDSFWKSRMSLCGRQTAAFPDFSPSAIDSLSNDHSLTVVEFDPNDRRYRCCCGQSHSTTGVRIIAGGLCVTVLLEFWQLCWHFLPSLGTSNTFPAPTTGSVVQLLFGLFTVSSVLFALWRESSNFLLPYLLLQCIGLSAVFVIFLALFYVVLDNDVETIKAFVNSHGPVKAATTDNAELVYMGWTLCLSCLCLLAIQLWLISIVFTCWRYFRDKRILFRGIIVNTLSEKMPMPRHKQEQQQRTGDDKLLGKVANELMMPCPLPAHTNI